MAENKRYTDKSGFQRDLTENQRNFCRLIVEGNTLTDSYRKAGYQCDGYSPKSLNAKSAHLFALPHIQEYIRELRTENENLSVWNRQETLYKLKQIADDAIEASHPVIRGKDGESITDDTGKVLRGYDPPSAQVALKAIQQASAMCGFNAPVESEQKIIIEIPEAVKAWAK